jgi:glycosyltransferase involved in cell wall biosynthesis
VPSIVTIHGILTECAKLNSNRVAALRELFQARITEHFVVERASHVISISPYVARYYQGRLGGVLHDIPNAVAPTFFSVQRAPVRGRILFAGRISKGKGVLDLVAAAAQDRHALDSLVLAGHIPDARFAEELTAVAKAGGIADRLKLTGLLDEEALLREFAHASVLVLPSYQETAPMVIQQAMAAGLPVIATRVGGIPDLINDGESGLLFEPGDISALSLQLGRIASEEGLAARLAANGARVAAAKFSASSVAAATKRAYARVIHGKDAPSGIS